MTTIHELSSVKALSRKALQPPPTAKPGSSYLNGLIAGVFFAAVIFVGTGNTWLSLNFGFGMFLVIGNILRFDDQALGITSGFLAALCASGVIGSFFGPDIGKVTALGLFAAVAPAVQLMDTEPGWGRGGRTFFGVCWAIAITAVFLIWFFDNYSLHLAIQSS